MDKPILKSERAEWDIVEQATFIADDNPEAADRYVDAVEAHLRLLSRSPRQGGPYKTSNPRLKGLRRLNVTGFPNYLIFYLDLPDHIHVLRILHGARDLPAILKDE